MSTKIQQFRTNPTELKDADVAAPVSAEDLERNRHLRLQSMSLSVLAIGAVLAGIYFAKPVLVVLLISILLSFILAPIADFLERWRIRRSLAALIAVFVLICAIGAIGYVSYNRAVSFAQELPRYSGRIRREVEHWRQKAESIQKTTEKVLPNSADNRRAIPVRQTSDWGNVFTENAANATEVAVLIGFIPFLVYFMLSWQDYVRASTVKLFKMENRTTAYVTMGMMSKMIRSFLVGNLLIGLFISGIGIVVFGLVGIPYFYFIGVISGFLSLVPYLGVILAMAPPLVASLGEFNSGKLLAILITVVGTHVFALNVLYPKLLGARLRLNPLAVTVALLFWGWLWGALGLILAIPMTAALKIVFDHIERLRDYGAWLGEG